MMPASVALSFPVPSSAMARMLKSASSSERLANTWGEFARSRSSTPYPTGYPETGYVVENKGTGYAQIQSSLLNAGMEPAEPRDELSLFILTIMKRRESSKPTLQQSANHLYGFAGKKTVFEYLGEAGPSKTSDGASALGVSVATARRRLAELVEQGEVVRIGEKNSPSVRYTLPLP